MKTNQHVSLLLLANGEEIICTVINEDDFNFWIQNPMLIIYNPNNGFLAMRKWSFVDSEGIRSISKKYVVSTTGSINSMCLKQYSIFLMKEFIVNHEPPANHENLLKAVDEAQTAILN